MRRRSVIALILVGVLVFLVISALLARAFSVGGAENAALTDLVTSEAHGDPAGVASLITGCRTSAPCRLHATQLAAALRHPGSVSVVQVNASAGFSLGSTTGTARIVWLAGSSLPRVQCVRVHHAGNVLRGFTIQLLRVSGRIQTDADCPTRF